MLSSLNFTYPNYYKPAKARRVSRACDECRKRKTKCIGLGHHCQTCIAKKVSCTFNFPSCKRGPKPKIRDTTLNTNNHYYSSPKETQSVYYPSPTSPAMSYISNDHFHLTPSLKDDQHSYFSLPPSSSNSLPVSPAETEFKTEPSIINTDRLLLNAYQRGDLAWLSDHQVLMLQQFFCQLNPENLLIDPNYLILGLFNTNVTPSFKYLFYSILTYTAYRHLPQIQLEFNDLYLSEDFYHTRSQLATQVSNGMHDTTDPFAMLNYSLVQLFAL